jgi:site-specific DNA recombinase
MGGVPPYGYDLRYEDTDGKFLFVLRHMPDGSKQVLNDKGKLTRTLVRSESLSISKRDRARLIPSTTDRVEVIKHIFKMYVNPGKGYRAIADTLNVAGTETPRGPQWSHIYSGKWTGTTVRAMLVNPIYAGDMVWNRRADGRFHRISRGKAIDRKSVHGARLVPNGKEDWIIVRNAHPALISRRLFEKARNRLENHPKSKEQKQHNHGKTWDGKRSRFILSGLMRCANCGSRYQGITRNKGKRRNDGTSVKTYYYGCGGYISKGRSICQPNLVPQKTLESIVIEAVCNFYRPYLESGGKQKLAQAVKAQTKTESREIASAQCKAQREIDTIERKIDNLLDNITETNRDHVDRRLNELTTQKQQIEVRLEELERLSLSQGEIDTIVHDSIQFLAGLESTLNNSLPQEKLTTLRQCIEKIKIDKPTGEVTLAIRTVPVGNLSVTQEIKTFV